MKKKSVSRSAVLSFRLLIIFLACCIVTALFAMATEGRTRPDKGFIRGAGGHWSVGLAKASSPGKSP
jgi:hypothetical protein